MPGSFVLEHQLFESFGPKTFLVLYHLVDDVDVGSQSTQVWWPKSRTWSPIVAMFFEYRALQDLSHPLVYSLSYLRWWKIPGARSLGAILCSWLLPGKIWSGWPASTVWVSRCTGWIAMWSRLLARFIWLSTWPEPSNVLPLLQLCAMDFQHPSSYVQWSVLFVHELWQRGWPWDALLIYCTIFGVRKPNLQDPHMFDELDVTFLHVASLPEPHALQGSLQRLLSYDFMGSLPYVAFVDLIRQDSRHRE